MPKRLKPVQTLQEGRELESTIREKRLGLRSKIVFLIATILLIILDISTFVGSGNVVQPDNFFAKWSEGVRRESGLRVDFQGVLPDEKLKWDFFNELFHDRTEVFNQGVRRLPSFVFDSTGYVWLVWYAQEGFLQTVFPQMFAFDTSGVIDTTFVRQAGADSALPGFASKYLLTRDRDVNMKQLDSYLAELKVVLVSSGKEFDVVRAKAPLTEELAQYDKLRMLKLFTLAFYFLAIGYLIRWHYRDVHAVLMYLLILRRTYLEAGYAVRMPSVRSAVLSWKLAAYIEHYKAELEEDKNASLERFRQQRQREVETAAKERRLEEFRSEVSFFFSEVKSLDAIPDSVSHALTGAQDEERGIVERRNALSEARSLLRQHIERLREEKLNKEQRRKEHELFSFVAAIDIDALDRRIQKRVLDLLDEYHADKRHHKRMRLLEEVLETARYVYDSGIKSSLHQEQVETEEDLSEQADFPEYDFVRMLDIADQLPQDIDCLHASEIILALLQPRQQHSCFHGRYRKSESVRNSVASKLGTPVFSQEKYDYALAWLLDAGVVLIPKPKPTQIVLSLNSRARQASKEGMPIVQKVLSLGYTLKKEFQV